MDEMIEQVAPTHVTLDDLEELMASLSAEEMEELAECDPDDSSMPPSMRCAYKCAKQPAPEGKVDMEKMKVALKDQALAIPDKKEEVKWERGTIRGKAYVPKVEEVVKKKSDDSDDEDNDGGGYQKQDDNANFQLDAEYSDALEMATQSDILDIADILGVTYQDHCEASKLKKFPTEAPNATNIDEVVKAAQANDTELMEINLNNIHNISREKWEALFAALKNNEHVESFSAANCDITDTVAQMISNCLENNQSIRQLNLESNSVSADMMINIIKSTMNSKTLEEFRVANQHNCHHLGSAIEYALVDLIPKVPHLVKLGVAMEFRDSLNKCAMALAKNMDKRRLAEDRSFTLKMDKSGKTGPKIISEKR